MLCACANPILELQTVGRVSWPARKLNVEARSFSALVFRVKGSGTLWTAEKSFHISPETVLYMPQGVPYCYDYDDTDMLLFHFVTQRNDPEPEIYQLKNPDELFRQFQKASQIWERKNPGYLGNCLSILYRILSLLAENEAKSQLPAPFVCAVSLLHSCACQSDLRIGDICSQAAISQTVFRQLFQRHYGKPPVTYLTELRLENARNLICAGISVEDAALESGFSDGKYFSRVVRQYYGCTPKQMSR